jgi:hypothetical protein
MTLLICCACFLKAQSPGNLEYQVKAVFIFNFTQFVEWPANSFTKEGDPFVIGILGENPFGSYLEEVIAGEKLNGHPLVVQKYKSIETMKYCQVLFISEENKTKEVLESIKGKSILTVGDGENFLKEGGIIRIYKRNNKIQIQINPEAAKSSNLSISSKLLRLAEIIVPKK